MKNKKVTIRIVLCIPEYKPNEYMEKIKLELVKYLYSKNVQDVDVSITETKDDTFCARVSFEKSLVGYFLKFVYSDEVCSLCRNYFGEITMKKMAKEYNLPQREVKVVLAG